jgi:protein gp37
MGIKTNIEWTDSSVNLEIGCSGCELWNPKAGVKRCYAGVLTERMTSKGPINGWPESFDKPAMFLHRMAEAERWKDLRGVTRDDKPWIPPEMPRLIFLDDMGDTFTESLPLDWLESSGCLERMAKTPHVYQILTKRPHRAREFFTKHPCPPNVWVGTSITGPNAGRIANLVAIDAPVRFISYEPAWEPVRWDWVLGLDKISWVIIGGESGKDAKPFDTDIIDTALDFFRGSDLKVFIKQLGARPMEPALLPEKGLQRLVLKDSHGGDWRQWWPRWRVREFPSVRNAGLPVCDDLFSLRSSK